MLHPSYPQFYHFSNVAEEKKPIVKFFVMQFLPSRSYFLLLSSFLTYVLTHIHTFLPTYLLTYLPTYSLTYILTYFLALRPSESLGFLNWRGSFFPIHLLLSPTFDLQLPWILFIAFQSSQFRSSQSLSPLRLALKYFFNYSFMIRTS